MCRRFVLTQFNSNALNTHIHTYALAVVTVKVSKAPEEQAALPLERTAG